MSCDECRELGTHEFRTPDDMVHAFQVAAYESERGVLRRLHADELRDSEREALHAAMAAGVPDALRYRFECTVCGDRFELIADTRDGSGGWTREERKPAAD
jgi:hypothetical protein